MLGRIVEISEPGRYVGVNLGFLIIEQDKKRIGQIPLDDIIAVIFSGAANVVSTKVIQKLTEHHAIIIFTDSSYHPANILWPLHSHIDYFERLQNQIKLSSVLKKKLWKQVITYKLINQKNVLFSLFKEDAGINELIISIQSGDKTNREAVAAKRYWKSLFGQSFYRSDSINPLNGALNYGYAILRAMMARYCASAGLTSSLGIHHHNKSNLFCLVDDLMEPYRPFVDYCVKSLSKTTIQTLTPELKKQLVALFYKDYIFKQKKRPLFQCIQQTVYSFIDSIESSSNSLFYPSILDQC